MSLKRLSYAVFFSLYFLWCSSASAGFKICNYSLQQLQASVAYLNDQHHFASQGWAVIESGACVEVDYKNRGLYYVYAGRADGRKFSGEQSQTAPSFCISKDSYVSLTNNDCQARGMRSVKFFQVITGKDPNYGFQLTFPGEVLGTATSGTIQERCLISWDDSQQVHSVQPIVRWDYQAVKTRMKKLSHCIKLTVTGPVDVSGIAKEYVNSCVDHALNDQKTLYILQGIVALGVDILGGEGAASSANVLAYIDSVKTSALSCLTDTGKMQNYMKNMVADKFSSTIQNESHWVYWDL